jgi:dihydrofolate reductase
MADLFVSLDGFAADADGGQDWIGGFGGPDMGRVIHETLGQSHVLLLGRKTYERLFGYWPKAKEPQAGPMNQLPKIVFSRTLKGPLEWNNATLVSGDLADAVRELKRAKGPPLRTIGSIELVKSMVALDLVDKLRLMVFPTVLGRGGKEPIFAGSVPHDLELVEHKVLDRNTLLIEYRIARKGATGG